MRCEPVVEPSLRVILGAFTGHFVLNNLYPAFKLLWFPFGVLKVKGKKRTLRKSNKGNV